MRVKITLSFGFKMPDFVGTNPKMGSRFVFSYMAGKHPDVSLKISRSQMLKPCLEQWSLASRADSNDPAMPERF